MSKKEKLLIKFKGVTKDFSWNELEILLRILGYKRLKSGKTGGAKVKFFNQEKDSLVNLHKPHNPPILKKYLIEQILEKLNNDGVI